MNWWNQLSMIEKFSLIGSIATTIGTIFLFFPNNATSDTKTYSGNQSQIIENMNGGQIIYNNQNVTNNFNKLTKKYYLKSTILFPNPTTNNIHIKNSLCSVENGSEIKVIDEIFIMTYWIKVKVLNGSCKDIVGWTGKENLIIN
ncbi:MAG: hypothetical protein AB7U24_02190 [Sulfurimonadaceae bacterium]